MLLFDRLVYFSRYTHIRGLTMDLLSNSEVVSWLKAFIADDTVIKYFRGTVEFILILEETKFFLMS